MVGIDFWKYCCHNTAPDLQCIGFTVSDIEDWDVYFEKKKEKLEERYETLVEEYACRFVETTVA